MSVHIMMTYSASFPFFKSSISVAQNESQKLLICGLCFSHCYADDTQLYLPMSMDHSGLSSLQKCTDDIKWNFMQFNSNKSEIGHINIIV